MIIPRKAIQNVKPYQAGKPIDEVRRELGLKDVIKLASNENPFGPSPKAIAAMKKYLVNVNRYPESGCFYLRQALSKKLKVKPENLIFGNGSDELIILALRAFVGEGDEVVVADPTFLIYGIASGVQGARVKTVPTRYFKYDLKAMKKAVTKNTRMVFLCNPDNPNGTYVARYEIEEFLKGLPENLIVFIDEAYSDYVQEKDYPDSLDYISRYNVIATRTFSKSYGLAGLRIGYGVSRPEIIKYMETVREPFNVNSLAQVAAVAALKDKKFLAKTKKNTREGRSFFYTELGKLGLRYIPSVTNFVVFEAGNDTDRICKKLMKQGVIVRNMKAWGLDDFIRVTVGTEKENKRFIRELRNIIA
ncbi:MAG TPA: histidinol-phosphate transaminase [Candidatus Omnitrophica bacterium]|nr:histidinol-phosphate transaminase [Candidatus Omnitrophota bacterium]